MNKRTKVIKAFIHELIAKTPQFDGSGQDIETLLAKILLQVESSWPGIEVDLNRFLEVLIKHLPNEKPIEWLTKRMKEMYLAFACSQQNPHAIQAFEAEYFSIVDATVFHLRLDPTLGQDIRQLIRKKLFVGDQNSEPKILQYQGRGGLHSWLRVIAFRQAIDILRERTHVFTLEEDALENLANADEDPAIGYMKKKYKGEFRKSFRQACAQLEVRERNILRHRLLDRLTFEEIANIYKVNETTVYRWMAAIRNKLLTHTQEIMCEQLQAEISEVKSIVRLVQSQFDTSMWEFLKEESI